MNLQLHLDEGLVNILGFMVSVATTQLCHSNTKAPTDKHPLNKWAWLCFNKTLFKNRQCARFGSCASLLIPDLDHLPSH